MPRRFFYLPPGLELLVLHDADELARLQTSPAFCGVVARPRGRVLARGLAVVVVVGEVEVAVHPYSDERAVGLKGDAVLTHEVELIGDIPTAARGLEVLSSADCTELTEKEGASDGLFHILACLWLNFSSTIGKFRATLLLIGHFVIAVKDFFIAGDKVHNLLEEFFKFGLRSIDEADFTSAQSGIGGQHEVVVGDCDVIDVGKVDSVIFADEELHIFTFLGLHYNICENRAKHAN